MSKSDDNRYDKDGFDAFIAGLVPGFVKEQEQSRAQHVAQAQEHTIDNARPFPAGADIPVAREKSKALT